MWGVVYPGLFRCYWCWLVEFCTWVSMKCFNGLQDQLKLLPKSTSLHNHPHNTIDVRVRGSNRVRCPRGIFSRSAVCASTHQP
jgi:hypothetical protein